jgi:hypothetical protein
VLEYYRLRWQIELVFKRMKSILGLGHLPKKDPISSQAWLEGKLFVGLLIERMIHVSAGIKHPHYCRFCRPPPGRGRGRYSTRDSIFCLAEPRCRR